jgi:5-methylcytosine-specific restriction endonuclease McrA
MNRQARINKKEYKRAAGKCRICKNPSYSQLDVHRLLPGEAGGKYTLENSVPICSNCHRAVHAKEIEIDRWYFSTAGYLLRIIVNGEERFV